MMQWCERLVTRTALLIVPSLGLAACAVATPVAVESTAPGYGSFSSVALQQAESGQTQRMAFADTLRRKFGDHAIVINADAPLLADYAISLRNSETGLAEPSDGAASAQGIDWHSAPRKGRLFDKCEAVRLRATLVLLSKTEGSVVYRGHGETNACNASESDFDRLAATLVDDAMAKASR